MTDRSFILDIIQDLETFAKRYHVTKLAGELTRARAIAEAEIGIATNQVGGRLPPDLLSFTSCAMRPN